MTVLESKIRKAARDLEASGFRELSHDSQVLLIAEVSHLLIPKMRGSGASALHAARQRIRKRLWKELEAKKQVK